MTDRDEIDALRGEPFEKASSTDVEFVKYTNIKLHFRLKYPKTIKPYSTNNQSLGSLMAEQKKKRRFTTGIVTLLSADYFMMPLHNNNNNKKEKRKKKKKEKT